VSPNRYVPPFEYTAEQIIESLLQAIRDDESDSVKEGLIGLLMVHYPDDFQRLDIAARLAATPEGHSK
jgi:hypothetical protein